jgi:hypothetical protein
MTVPEKSNPAPAQPITGDIDLTEFADEPNQIRVILKPSHRPNVLASVTIELETELGTITINDGRILKNKAGALWFALPTFSVTSGKQYEYFPSIELPSSLLRNVSDAALAAYERSEREGGEL